MNQVVTITNTKENVIEFDIDVKGIDSKDLDINFVIEAKEMEIGFKCSSDDGKWIATVPALKFLEKTAYRFHIDVIADGYYFKPASGVLNVVGSPEIYSTEPKNTTLSPKEEKKVDSKKEENEEEKKEVKEKLITSTPEKRAEEKTIEEIAASLLKRDWIKPKTQPTAESEIEKKTKRILKETKENKTPPKTRKKVAKKKEPEVIVEKEVPEKIITTVPVKDREIKNIIEQIATKEKPAEPKGVVFKKGKTVLH